MGLSRNKVAVSEGAAGSPPFYGERTEGRDCLCVVSKRDTIIDGDLEFKKLRTATYELAAVLYNFEVVEAPFNKIKLTVENCDELKVRENISYAK